MAENNTRIVSPGYIRQLLDIYSLPKPELNELFVNELCTDGLIDRRDCPAVTDKGAKWIELLEATPFPVQKWIDPREDERRSDG